MLREIFITLAAMAGAAILGPTLVLLLIGTLVEIAALFT